MFNKHLGNIYYSKIIHKLEVIFAFIINQTHTHTNTQQVENVCLHGLQNFVEEFKWFV